jgi:hypothetical protein
MERRAGCAELDRPGLNHKRRDRPDPLEIGGIRG